MKYSKLRIQDEPARLEWWKRKLEADKDIEIISISEILENKGTDRYFHIFVSVIRTADKKECN